MSGWDEIPLQTLVSFVHIVAAGAVTVHVLRRDLEVRAAAGWIGVAWLSPLAGPLIYYLLGINRVYRRATWRKRRRGPAPAEVKADAIPFPPETADHYRAFVALIERVTHEPLVAGNRVEPLENGDEAYPAMLAAIDAAKTSVALCTYIFRDDAAGRPFIAALARAQQRGVAVRVLIDGMGGGYLWSPARRALERAGVPVAQFFHTWIPWRMPYVNMRLHKKLLIVDGAVGFAGGMNIGRENLREGRQHPRVCDHHFRIEGPVVGHLLASFAEDWRLETGEALKGPAWRAAAAEGAGKAAPADGMFARGVASGPDEEVEKLVTILLAAIGAARERVRIVTPYFVPERVLLTALTLAALRGVKVEIVLPERSNHPPLDWAAFAQHGRLVESGCDVYLAPPPFDHTKLMTIDGGFTMFGSANWDSRSLRLNFEYNVLTLGADFTARMDKDVIDRKIAASQRLTARKIAARGRLAKLRDGLARLFLPYL